MKSCLEYHGYHASISFDAEDSIFVGTVIGVADSLSFHGSNVQELLSSFHSCIDGYLEFCEEIGKSPDKEYKGSLNIRLSPDIHRQAAILAEGDGISLNQFIADAVAEKCKSLSV